MNATEVLYMCVNNCAWMANLAIFRVVATPRAIRDRTVIPSCVGGPLLQLATLNRKDNSTRGSGISMRLPQRYVYFS